MKNKDVENKMNGEQQRNAIISLPDYKSYSNTAIEWPLLFYFYCLLLGYFVCPY